MKIELTTNIGVLGKKGDIVSVGKSLATGLIRRRQAKPASGKATSKDDSSTDYTALEAAKMVRDMDDKQAEQFTKDETRKTVLKELKDEISTKEEKFEYQTK